MEVRKDKTNMNKLQRNNVLSYFSIITLFALGIFVRIRYLNYVSGDMKDFFIPWYDFIKSHGIFKALSENFTQYPPLYTYFLSIMTLTPIPKVIAIKLITITFDFVSAFMVYKTVQLIHHSKFISLLAAGIFLCLPTIFINSAIWGETDSIYASFLLISLYFFVKEQPLYGMLAFSFSFAIKAQSVLMVPFLIILLYKKRIRLWHFILVPSVYILLSLPVILLGRNWFDVLTIYLHQSNTYQWLSGNAPNFYFIIPNEYYQPAFLMGIAFALISLGLWILFTVKDKRFFNNEKLVILAFISVTLSPFLLPKMHERFFYPADVFSFILAFYVPELWFLPIACQIASGLSYMPFMLSTPKFIPLTIAASVNAILLIYLLRRQFYNSNPSPSLATTQ